MHKLKKKYRKEFLKLLYAFKDFRCEDAVVIYSEPRSGSTWLMEIIQYYTPNSVINWEPLDHRKGVLPSNCNIGWRLGKPIDEENNFQIISYFKEIITMKKINHHTLMLAGIKELFSAKWVITKFVRANEIIPLLLGNFPDTRFIYLQRHPLVCSVSQLKNFNKINSSNIWNEIPTSELPEIFNLPGFEKDRAFILTLNTYIEREVAIWCFYAIRLENRIQDKEHNIFKVFYEELVNEPFAVLERINEKFRFLNLEKPDFPFNNASKSNYRNTYDYEDRLKNNSIFNSWESEKLEKIQAVFNHFKYRTYTAFSPYPRVLINE
ncbi:sulfotransferase domain-containing protein [Salegentibacter sediminis]|uniref:sulfotransferase domain-containing protein n=1 Tax=Salegentibacter sediminis TaxID=1930251 RepID=UPI0009C16D14|nr:sulfotransferase domain-containing protein [Salegentibacter sediminis]